HNARSEDVQPVHACASLGPRVRDGLPAARPGTGWSALTSVCGNRECAGTPGVLRPRLSVGTGGEGCLGAERGSGVRERRRAPRRTRRAARGARIRTGQRPSRGGLGQLRPQAGTRDQPGQRPGLGPDRIAQQRPRPRGGYRHRTQGRVWHLHAEHRFGGAAGAPGAMTGPGPAGAARTFTAAQAGLFNAALQQLRGGSAAAALPLARQLVAQAPAVADAHQLLAMCLADTGDAERADASFRTAVRLAPGNPVPLVNFATWLRRVGRTAEALDGFRRAAALAPGHAPAWVQVGLMELDAGRPHEALEALERAVRAQPRALDAWMGLAAAHRATGNLE